MYTAYHILNIYSYIVCLQVICQITFVRFSHQVCFQYWVTRLALEPKAGIPFHLLVAAHGNFDAAHVVDDNVGLASSYDVDITELQDALHDPGDEGWQDKTKRLKDMDMFGEDVWNVFVVCFVFCLLTSFNMYLCNVQLI